jgi:hypothetical protein
MNAVLACLTALLDGCREAHTKSSRAEAEMRRLIQASIAELEGGAAQRKDFSWLMKVGQDIASLTTKPPLLGAT